MPSCTSPPPPAAIVGIGLRLPGDVSTTEDFWNLLINKRDAKCPVPADRYNASALVGTTATRQKVTTPTGYFLNINLKLFDDAFFQYTRQDLESFDPQQKLLMEVISECIDNAGQGKLRGSRTGVYVGAFGEDWHDMVHLDPQSSPNYRRVTGAGDYMLSNMISHVFDLRGPSITVRTACSASMTALHLACQALYNGDCDGAIVAGSSLVITPAMTMDITEQGVLSPNGSCQTFDAKADGFARGEAINAVYIKLLDDAVRDNDPIRTVIRATAVNSDGGTTVVALPSQMCQETMIRRAYEVAGISDITDTPFVECHGTGTQTGDPIETRAVASVFGGKGTYIGSVKSNVGHAEGAAGLNSVIKAVLALENETIPPNIHFSTPSPNIPFEMGKLMVPVEPIPWPKDRPARISINSMGIGGANAHVILESAASHNIHRSNSATFAMNGAATSICNGHNKKNGIKQSLPYIIPISAASPNALKKRISLIKNYTETRHGSLGSLAYTLALRRRIFAHRSFAVARDLEGPLVFSPSQVAPTASPSLVFVFTGQGAQWAGMGRDLMNESSSFRDDIKEMDNVLQALPMPPPWTIEDVISSDTFADQLSKAEFAQPLCTAVQIALVNFLAKSGVTPDAVVGHSSGEIGAAYAAGGLTPAEAITSAFYRGYVMKSQSRVGRMAAVGRGPNVVRPYLASGVSIACENSPQSVTISGDIEGIERTIEAIKSVDPDAFVRRLHVEVAYHSYHMVESGQAYEDLIKVHVQSKVPSIPFYSSVTGNSAAHKENFGPSYWRRNLESPVLFNGAVETVLKDFTGPTTFLEVGPHSALQGPLQQIFRHCRKNKAPAYVASMIRNKSSAESALAAVGQLFAHGHAVDFGFHTPKAPVLTDIPNYPWDHQSEFWKESRVSKAWRFRSFQHHELLGSRCLEASDAEPAWRNIFRLYDLPWMVDHKMADGVLFPFAGYISLIGEAIRQITGSESYLLRNFMVKSAMLVPESDTIEIMTSMKPARLTEVTNSTWYDVTVHSFNGSAWIQHCVAQGKGGDDREYREPVAKITVDKTRSISAAAFYRGLRSLGLDLGPRFQNLKDISTGIHEDVAIASAKEFHVEKKARYTAHPFLLDICLQMPATCIIGGRGASNDPVLRVPSYIREMEVNVGGTDMSLQASVRLEANGNFTSDVAAFTKDGQVAVRIEGLTYLTVESRPDNAPSLKGQSLARLDWQRHIDFCDPASLVRPAVGQRDAKHGLQKATALLILKTLDGLMEMALEAPPVVNAHLIKHLQWLQSQEEEMLRGHWDSTVPEASGWASSTDRQFDAMIRSLLDEIDSGHNGFPKSFVWLARKLMEQDTLRLILSGKWGQEMDALLKAAEMGDLLQHGGWTLDMGELLHLISHTKPRQRVLEIGAGVGAATRSMLAGLTSDEGVPMFSEYTLTDSCPLTLAAAKERFKDVPSLRYADLDILESPTEQGFESNVYDLIILSDIPGASAQRLLTLKNVRSLLREGGRLLLLTPVSLQWRFIPFSLGLILPSWWENESKDGKADRYHILDETWEAELSTAGFSGAHHNISDDDDAFRMNSIIVCQVEVAVSPPKTVTMVYKTKKHDFAVEMGAILEEQGIEVRWSRFGDDVEQHREDDIIFTFDLEGPLCFEFSKEEYAMFLEKVRQLQGRVIWLTRPAQVRCTDPRYGLVPGFSRNLRLELGLSIFTVELDLLDSSASRITASIVQKIRDTPSSLGTHEVDFEYCVFDDAVHVGRYRWSSLSGELDVSMQGLERTTKKLTIGKYGLIDSLHWVEQEQQVLQADEVEVEMRYVGLNFRDLMITMGLIPGARNKLGIEGAGIVSRVGDLVSNHKVGDRVMLMMAGVMSTRVICRPVYLIPIPEWLVLEEAAALPVAYFTALQALEQLGHLRKGQSVLIHSACGGVGLVAMAHCTLIGAEIYATVGSETKIQHLMEKFGLPRERIFNSHNTSFYSGVMTATAGRGVDLVLNSLSGELLRASWRCVAKGGKMMEIGKRDIFERGTLALDMFSQNRSFYGIDLENLDPELYMDSIPFREHLDRYQASSIKPLDKRFIYTAEQVPEALRFLRLGRHIGKIVIELPEKDSDIPSTQDSRTEFLSKSSTYLIVGGMGGLGKAVALWMVEKGARNIVFLSRSAGKSVEDQKFLAELEGFNCLGIAVAGSVAVKADVQRALAAAPTPISGVIQMSMVIRDLPLSETNYENWTSGIEPKVKGTWTLHEELGGVELDFFILFGSIVGLWGQPGQANYAAANTFLDSFAQYRHSLGLPCSVIDLGAVEDVGWVSQNPGILKHYKGMNMGLLNEQDVVNSVQAAIRNSRATSTQPGHRGGYFNPGQFAAGLICNEQSVQSRSHNPLCSDIRTSLFENAAVGDESEEDGVGADFKALLKTLATEPEVLYEEETTQRLAKYLSIFIRELMMLPTDDVDTSASLSSLGIDSLHSVEMRDQLRKSIGVNFNVIEIKNAGTIDGLAKLVVAKLKEKFGLKQERDVDQDTE